MSPKQKRFVIPVGFIIICAAIALAFTSNSTALRNGASSGFHLLLTMLHTKGPDSQYFTEPVERGSIQQVVNATGNVQAFVTVQVGSQVSGQIQALYADYNSVVKRGQLLAKLDPRNFEADVANFKANLVAAQAHLRSAEADLATQQANLASARANVEAARVTMKNDALIYQRYLAMSESGIIAQNDLDTARATSEESRAKYAQAQAAEEQVAAQINSQKAQVEQARAQVLQAQADLNKAQVNLEYTNIYSPVDGVVVSRNVDVGQTVAASLQAPLLFVIANDLTKMQVNANVDEADIGRIVDNVGVKFTVDAYPNETFTGKITEIRLNPQTVQNVVTYSVIITVNNKDLKLKPGMTANITVTVAKKNDALKIQNAALRYRPAGEAALRQTLQGSGDSAGSASNLRAKTDGAGSGAQDTYAGAGTEGPSTKQKSSSPKSGSRRERVETAKLAPGQLWNDSQKIQFPDPPRHTVRPAVVWVLDAANKPEPRRVMLGISDGIYTEVASGDLNQGDRVIIADLSQENASNDSSGVRSPFGLAPAKRR